MTARKTAPKIFLRGSRFYIRVQVPKELQTDVGRKEFWVSLKTQDRDLALVRALEKTKSIRNDFDRQLRKKRGEIIQITTLTKEQRLDLAREAYDLHLRNLEKIRLQRQADDELDWEEYLRNHREHLYRIEKEVARQGAGHDFVEALTNDILGYNLLSMNPGTPAFAELGQLVADAALNAQRTFQSRLEGFHLPERPDPRFVDPTTGETHSFRPMVRQTEDAAAGAMSMIVLIRKYADSPHRPRTKKTRDSIYGYLRVVSSIMGDDKDIRTITSSDCLNVRDVIRRLPPNFQKLQEFNSKSLEQIAEITSREQRETLGPTGVNNYIKQLYAFLNWCAGNDFIDRVPMKWELVRVHDPVAPQDKRKPFSFEQLQTLFDSEVYTDGLRSSALFWVPLIALWNGMRANEICQLDVADLDVVDGHHVFDVSHLTNDALSPDKRTKNRSSVRVVPIHPKLIDLGLLEFHRHRTGERKLFADITLGADGYYSTTFSKKVNRYLKRIGILGPKHKFHSLRHNFRDALRRGGVDPGLAKELGGWTRGKSEAFEIYGQGYGIDQLSDAIERVDYPEVDLSHLLPSSNRTG